MDGMQGSNGYIFGMNIIDRLLSCKPGDPDCNLDPRSGWKYFINYGLIVIKIL